MKIANLIILLSFVLAEKAFSYEAECRVDDGMANDLDYDIEVKDRTLIVRGGNKYPFLGKSNGWYVYGSNGLRFSLGPFDTYTSGSSKFTRFELHITNDEDDWTATGSCHLYKNIQKINK